MKRSRFTDEQVINILQKHEAGAKCADLCRKHGMSAGTFYAWKSKFSGMSVPDVKRLKALEQFLIHQSQVGGLFENLQHLLKSAENLE